jgi:hypothetical protein
MICEDQRSQLPQRHRVKVTAWQFAREQALHWRCSRFQVGQTSRPEQWTMLGKLSNPCYLCFTDSENLIVAMSTLNALVAQLVEHLICNQGVPGSNPGGGTIFFLK